MCGLSYSLFSEGRYCMSDKGFRTGLVSRLVGLSFNQIDYYDRHDLVKPEIREASGPGSRRLFSRKNLVELAVVRKLLDRGLTLQRIRKGLKEARQRFPEVERPLCDLLFRTDGSSIYVNDPGGQSAVDLLHPDQPVLAIAIESVARQIDHAILKYENHRIEQLTIRGKTYLLEIVNDTETHGVVVRCPDLLGISAKGATVEEALERMKERIIQAVIWLRIENSNQQASDEAT